MELRDSTAWERSLAELARSYEYPPTPDVASAVGGRIPRRQVTDTGAPPREQAESRGTRRAPGGRFAWVFILIALTLAGLMAAPTTRAAILAFFARVGAIDIIIDESSPTPRPTAAGVPAPGPPPTALPVTVPPAAGTDAPAPNRLVEHSLALFESGEPMALEEARQLVDFRLALPGVLDEPDEVYVHRGDIPPAVTLVWRDEAGAILSLTEIGAEAFAMKMVAEEDVSRIQVGGREAVWLEGPHHLQLFGSAGRESLLIESNVLIWAGGGVTYRLEGELSRAEMVALAESVGE